MIAAVFVLLAVVIGVSSLPAFGFGGWEIVVILAPVAAGVLLFVWAVMRFGMWTARLLNRPEGDPPGQEGERKRD